MSMSSDRPSPPVSNKELIAVMIVIMNEAISVSMLFPYVGLLVLRVDPSLKDADAGMMSGLVVGCFQFAQALFGPTWGKQSDRWGRKPMMALGLCASTIFAVCFGLSTSIWQLLLFRFLYGVANGTAPLCKTMIAEMTTPRTAAKGWSLMSTGRSIGSTIGPMLGGLLYDPANQISSSVFGGTVFERHPALLPALAGALYSLFALLVVFHVLPETNTHATPPYWIQRVMNRKATVANVDATADANPKTTPAQPTQSSFGLADMIQQPNLCRVLAMYVSCCIVNTSFTEVFPLLAILPIAQGGLGLTARPIGFVFMIIAAEAVATNTLFPAVLKRTSRLDLLRGCLVVWGVFIALTPVLTMVPWIANETWIVLTASAYLLFRTATSGWCLSITTMAIADLSPREHLGVATALSHSCGNFARAFIPPFCTMIFAWSVGSDATPVTTGVDVGATFNATISRFSVTPSAVDPPFPRNKFLVFLLLGGGIAASTLLSTTMSTQDLHSPVPPLSQVVVDPVPLITGEHRDSPQSSVPSESTAAAPVAPSNDVETKKDHPM